MLKIIFDDHTVYVSYGGGMLYPTPLTNEWLWLIGALEAGEKIIVKDERTKFEDHQHQMSFTLNDK